MFDKIVERGRYTEQDASAAMRQVFEAVNYLHANRIAHRDLKPENLLSVERHGREIIKLADFVRRKFFFFSSLLANPPVSLPQGLARTFGDTNGMSTACGSPLYVAPEVLFGQAYGPAVDLWACGVILFLLLSGCDLVCLKVAASPEAHLLFVSCSTSPFPNGPDVQRLFREIQTNSWSFRSPEWDNVSDAAKDLVRVVYNRSSMKLTFFFSLLSQVRQLMNPDPAMRYTAAQALQHPWIASATELPNVPLNAAYTALSRSRIINQPGWTP